MLLTEWGLGTDTVLRAVTAKVEGEDGKNAILVIEFVLDNS